MSIYLSLSLSLSLSLYIYIYEWEDIGDIRIEFSQDLFGLFGRCMLGSLMQVYFKEGTTLDTSEAGN